MSTIDHIIKTYGLIALYFGVIIEGETVVLIAGILAHRGDFGPYPQGLIAVAAVAVAATLSGDNLFFLTGRFAGKTFLKRFESLQLKVEKIRKVFNKHPFIITMTFRAIYGVRIATPCVVGMSKFSHLHFFLMDLASSFAWAVTYACLGYMFGHLIDRIFADAHKYELWIALGIGVAGTLVFIIYRYRQKMKAKKAIETGELQALKEENDLEEKRIGRFSRIARKIKQKLHRKEKSGKKEEIPAEHIQEIEEDN